MKKSSLTLLFFLTCALLTACSSLLENVQKEGSEAITNIQTEAQNVTDTVNEKVDQVNSAVDSVNTAVDSVSKAVEDIKAVGQ